jgi:hypothetical protein
MSHAHAVHTKKESVMAKTTKKPVRKAAAKQPPALKAMENMVIKTADLEVHLKQVTERLNAAGISSDIGSIAYAAAPPLAPVRYK